MAKKPELPTAIPDGRPVHLTAVADLKPHPRNYREHPPDQLAHIEHSLREYGFYRNVVIANDATILAGHGVVLAARNIGATHVPTIELPLAPDSPAALRILTADNELVHFGVVDDRLLTEILKELNDVDGLMGTGYDGQMLANLLFVTRPEHEIRTGDDAAQWVGLPGFEPAAKGIMLVLHFDDAADRDRLVEQLGVTITRKERMAWGAWWPPREKRDIASLLFDG